MSKRTTANKKVVLKDFSQLKTDERSETITISDNSPGETIRSKPYQVIQDTP